MILDGDGVSWWEMWSEPASVLLPPDVLEQIGVNWGSTAGVRAKAAMRPFLQIARVGLTEGARLPSGSDLEHIRRAVRLLLEAG